MNSPDIRNARPIARAATRLSGIALALLVSGCVSLSSPPARTPYSGVDRVDSADRSSIVGHWRIRHLNPIEGENTEGMSIVYRDDGTVVSELSQIEGTEGLGDMAFEFTGNWQLTGDVVTHSNMVMRETSGNQFGGLMTAMVNSQRDRIAGTANIYELEANRMVWVGQADGAAYEYTRLP